jgi:hypothetical protein
MGPSIKNRNVNISVMEMVNGLEEVTGAEPCPAQSLERSKQK